MPSGSRIVCTRCRYTVPLTGFWMHRSNPVRERLADHIPIEEASGFLYFAHGSGWRELIHRFKYDGAWRLARDMGIWYGHELVRSGLYDRTEVIVPVPLHPLKRLRRGYNQSEYIARGIGRVLGVPVDERSVRRSRNNPSQALHAKRDRWANVDGIFAVRRPERLAGRHILLVDDVLTTGATLLSCAETILRACPGCRISVAVLAVSRRELGIDR